MFSPTLKNLIRNGSLWLGGRTACRRTGCFAAPFGVPEIDNALPLHGLPFGSVHEWLLEHPAGGKQPNRTWFAPLELAAVLLGNALRQKQLQAAHDSQKLIIWIGRHCWPTPHLLHKHLPDAPAANSSLISGGLQFRSIFIEAENRKRLWAITQALRSPAAFAVLADGRGLSLAATRRLQLAAEKGNTLGVLFRPPWESEAITAANTRWKIKSLPCSENAMKWEIELQRIKGSIAYLTGQGRKSGAAGSLRAQKWIVEWNEEQNDGNGGLCLSAASGEESQRFGANAF